MRAKEDSVPAYIIFDDKTLKLLSNPTLSDVNDLINIKGIGPKKVEKYGKDIIDIINSHEEQ